MIPIIIPKTGIERTRTRLTVILFWVMFAGTISGCAKAPTFIPAELNGKYITTHPGYEDQYFELSSKLIIMGFGDGTLKVYYVERVEKRIRYRGTLYTALCVNEDIGEEFNFSFFADIADEVVIHFKNKPQVFWEKEKPEIYYNDNSDARNRH